MNARRGPSRRGSTRPIFPTLLPVLLGLAARPTAAQQAPEWGGYIQARYTRTSAADSGFSIRRAKLWLAGRLDQHFSYRVQARFQNPVSGGLVLQDAWLGYRAGQLALQVGQLVPAFSLQRSQADYEIPVVERAQVVDALIPTAETGARDVGIQAGLPLANGHLQADAGLFNGTGGNQAQTRPHGYLLTQRTIATGGLGHGLLAEVGYSFALRQAQALCYKRIFQDTARFTGRDLRWGADARLAHPRWEIQAEYIEADLGASRAWGWYTLAAYRVGRADQLVALVDRYHDLARAPDDRPWLGTGWNHDIPGDRARLMFAGRARFDPGSTAYAAVAQLQLMFR